MFDVWELGLNFWFYLHFLNHLGDGGSAPSLGGLKLDGSLVPLGLTATHDPSGTSKSLWARWKP